MLDCKVVVISLCLAQKFHELRQAYELLLDPHRRVALDAKLRIKKARAERYKNYDHKRKNLVEELEERERSFKKARVDKQKEEAVRWEQTEKIKDQGRRLREEKEKEKLLRQQQQSDESATSDEPILRKCPIAFCNRYLISLQKTTTRPSESDTLW